MLRKMINIINGFLKSWYDKTADYRSGNQFGNAYHVANGVWKSIHNPITSEMLSGKWLILKTVKYITNNLQKTTTGIKRFSQ